MENINVLITYYYENIYFKKINIYLSINISILSKFEIYEYLLEMGFRKKPPSYNSARQQDFQPEFASARFMVLKHSSSQFADCGFTVSFLLVFVMSSACLLTQFQVDRPNASLHVDTQRHV